MITCLPIRVRVTLAFAAAITLVLAAFGLFLYVSYEDQLDETVNDALEVRSTDLESLLAGQASGPEPVIVETLDPEDGFAQVIRLNGVPVLATAQVADRSALEPAEIQRAARSELTFDREAIPGIDGRVRILARPIVDRQSDLIAVVGSSLENRDESLRQLALLLLLGGPAALALATLAGYWVAGRALGPVESMRSEAAAISAESIGGRLAVPAANDELRRLGTTLNEMLARLEGAIDRERRFVDDASHELRTPLALHKTELEIAQRYAANEDELRAAIASGIEEIDRLAQLADDLLVVARSGEGDLTLNREELDAAALLATVAIRFRSRAAAAGREVEVQDSRGISLQGDRLRLEQALTNIVENALRHGDGRVELAAESRSGAVRIHVRDEGAGFSAEFQPRAFERFSRADAARGRGGVGLGLAIVQAIARAHGGSAGIDDRPGGGADVWIQLP